eukprot:486247_1
MMLQTVAGCQIAGDIGIAVQLILGILVLFVLVTEYLFEYVYGSCSVSNNKNIRSFRTFWFDSYKICTGALISHLYNVGIALIIKSLTTGNVNECAIYSLSFYYETCGVPFLQLLQYGIIKYAIKMSTYTTPVNNINKTCKKRWQWISNPGKYDANRYPVKNCIQCKHCELQSVKLQYVYLTLIFIISLFISIFIGYLSYLNDNDKNNWVEDVCIALLAFIFILTTSVAPISSLWQTLQWISIKIFEKTIWSLFAISQAKLFGKWSLFMSTGNATIDAILYIAILPIILNAIMFFMFSRISRLKLPCFDTVIDDNNLNIFNKKEAYKIGVVFMVIFNGILFVLSIVFLLLLGGKDAYESILVLFISIIIVPISCSIGVIYLLQYIIENNKNICCLCCGNSDKESKHDLNVHTALKNENDKHYSSVS